MKGLVEDGEMLLGDGRRILRDTSAKKNLGEIIVPVHPNFKMIVLANRPGYPFQVTTLTLKSRKIYCHVANGT